MRYASKGLTNAKNYGLIPFSGYRNDLTFSIDGETVYISNIFPNAPKKGTFLKGIMGENADGARTITIPANQLINRYDTLDEYMLAKVGMTAQEYAKKYNTTIESLKRLIGWTGPMPFYFVPAKADDAGEKVVLMDEYVLTEDADGVFSPDPAYQTYLFSWRYGDQQGWIEASANICFQKITSNLCEVPSEGVEWKQFMHQWDAAAFEDGKQLCQVGFKGDKVYIPGIIPDIHESYAEGAIDGEGIITITADPLFILDETLYYHTIQSVDKSAAYDPSWTIIFSEEYPNYKLKYDSDKGTLTPVDGMKVVDIYCYGQDVDIYQHKYKLYEKDMPAVPAAARSLKFYTQNGNDWFSFELPEEDADGYAINPENMYYRCFVNNDSSTPYVFEKGKYVNLAEDKTEIPLLYTAPNYDFVYDNGWSQVYWFETNSESFGVQSCYDVDGVKNYSEIVWESNPNSSIISPSLSPDAQDDAAYDIYGRKVGPEYKGLVIKNNKKYIQK